jgi:hypothetical protein
MGGGENMRGFIAGVVIGFLLSTTTVAFALTGFYDTTSIFAFTRSQHVMYVAGATDMLHAAASSARDRGGVAWISRQSSCMAEKGTLGVMTDWAVAKWTGAGVDGKYQAASVLLDSACD